MARGLTGDPGISDNHQKRFLFFLILGTVLFLLLTAGAAGALPCPAGCECLLPSQAEAKWPGGFTRCSDTPCNYDHLLSPVLPSPMYCYRGISTVTTTPTTIIPVTVSSYQPVYNTPPVARIAVHNAGSDNSVPLTVIFDARSSYDPDNPDTIVSSAWAFGDGTTAHGLYVTHTFTNPAVYAISLTVTDTKGATGSASVQVQALPHADRAAPPYPSAPAERESTTVPGLFTGAYPVGFSGLDFNRDGLNTLEITLSAARENDAVVTLFPDRVEVYQHSSSAVLITFKGEKFTTENGRISGTVSRAEFATSPLQGQILSGNVSGSVLVTLHALSGRGEMTTSIYANETPGAGSVFREFCTRNNCTYYATAFVMNITKSNLEQTGSANLTFTLPRPWVDEHGGTANVSTIRISEKGPAVQNLATAYLGTDPAGSMVFSAYSPDGTSLFGIITADALTRQGIEPSAGQIQIDIRMLLLVFGMLADRPYLVSIGVVVVLAGAYALNRKIP